MYHIIKTDSFVRQHDKYIKQLTPLACAEFDRTKQLFSTNPFDDVLSTHSLYQRNNIIVYTCYINRKDRLISFFKDPNIIYPYKIITDHDYKKLQKTLKAFIQLFIQRLQSDQLF